MVLGISGLIMYDTVLQLVNFPEWSVSLRYRMKCFTFMEYSLYCSRVIFTHCFPFM